jgi:hypothetical protein
MNTQISLFLSLRSHGEHSFIFYKYDDSAMTSGEPQNPTRQLHHFTSPQYPMNYPPQFPANFHPQNSHMFIPFGSQSNYPQFSFSSQGSYQGTSYQGMVQYPPGVGDPSMGFFQGSRGNDSRVDESSPISSTLFGLHCVETQKYSFFFVSTKQNQSVP